MNQDKHYEFLVVDFDRTLCRLFSDSELQQMEDLVETELPYLSTLAIPGTVGDPYKMWGLVRRQLAVDASPRLGVAESAIRRMLSEWEDSRANTVDPFGGVEPALSELSAQGLLVAIFSNNDESAIRKCLNRWGLSGTVTDVIGRSPQVRIADLKPSPVRLEPSLIQHGMSPSQTLYVGDSDEDAECASRLSIEFVRVSGVPEMPQDDGLLRTFGDVPEYLSSPGL